MASRLMLSLKKASVQPKAVWSLETMTNPGSGTPTEEARVRFAARVPGGSHENPLTPADLDEEGIELGATP